jgi:signal transduction histidine kinase/CheY-like chemotaxis protein
MSLSSKTLVLLLLVLALGTGLAYGVLSLVVQPGFAAAERLEARTDVARCVAAIDREIAHLAQAADVAARGDAVRDALRQRDPAPFAALFPTETFTSCPRSYVALLEADGHLLWRDARDEASGVPVAIDELPSADAALVRALPDATARAETRGVVPTPAGPMLVVACPVLRGAEERIGAVVMARLFSPALREELSSQVRAAFRILDVASEPEADERAAFTQAVHGELGLREVDADELVGYAPLAGLDGRASYVVAVALPRRITPVATALLRSCFAFFIAIAALLLAVLHRRLRRAVLEPIAALSCAVREYTHSGAFPGRSGSRVPEDGEGELGALGADVNTMLRGLEQAQVELRTAKEAAEAANVAKTQFLTNMSHEIRTPMNGIVGMAQHLLSMPLTAEVRECVETVRRSSDLMLALLNDVLDYSKIDAGHLTLERLEFDPRDVVEGIGEIVAWNAHRRGLSLVTDVRPGVPTRLVGDPVRLRQALLNFASNAVKFTEAGEVVVAVEVESESPAHTVLRFTVKDTGIGIAPEHVERLFRAFSQVDASTTRRFGGTGLGLAIAKQLATRMQGDVGVESRLGAGSTFWFTARIERPAAAAATAAPEALRGLRVFLVDPSVSGRRAIAHLVMPWSAQFAACEGPDAAIAALTTAAAERAPVGLVVIDDQVEGGAEALARRIRATASLATTPLLRLARLGTPPAANADSAFSATADKPLRAVQFVQRAAAALAGRPEPKEPAVAAAPAPTGLDILLAEDNPANQQVVELVLKRHGHRVRIVGNGKEAVAACAEGRHDLVLMDSHMPIMDGLEATRLIRAAEAPDGRTPIIALTAVAQEGAREMFLRAGFDDYVAKPFRVEDLLATIDRWSPHAAPGTV